MRTINEQIADINSGAMTVEQVIAEGVHPYAIKFFSPSKSEAEAYFNLRKAYEATTTLTTVEPATQEMQKCSCGCVVQKSLVMSASFGTSCPDCYDRMSI